jgi:RimJ/RimL family protein N-acetyltransferase
MDEVVVRPADLADESSLLALDRAGWTPGLHVLGSNRAAQALYERMGYVVEGRYREEFLIDGDYVDDVSLGKFLVTPTLRQPEVDAAGSST